MADIERVKTGIFEMLQRNTWKDIDGERRRFQTVLNDALKLLKEQHETIKNLEQEIRDKNVRLTERAEQVEHLLKKSVPQGVVDQIRWERDTALSQLKEIGKGLGEKMDDVKPKWIPVSERKPNSCGVYIVARWFIDGCRRKILTDACYFDGSNTWHDDTRVNHSRPYLTDKIVAWMPLPNPPKAGEQE